MTAIKLLSAGLIATFMFTISATAHENVSTKRCLEMKGNAGAWSGDCWNHGNARIPAPHLGKFAVRPHDDTDGI